MSKTEIKRLHNRAKNALNRLEANFSLTLSKNDIKFRLNRLDEIFVEFDKLDSQLPENISEIDEFEKKYFELKVKYQNLLDNLNVPKPVAVNQNETVSNNNFKLPKLIIPTFSGDFKDWLHFKDLFVATVHSSNLTKIQKFQYLVGLLAEKPASIIKHIPLSENAYDEAWSKLIARYDDKKQIVNSLLRTFFEQPSITKVNNVNLRKFVDVSDEVFRGLKALGDEASSRDVLLIFLMLQKLDIETKKQWSEKTANEEFPNLELFFNFLNTRCSALDVIEDNISEFHTGFKGREVASKPLQNSQIDHLKCLKCNAIHPLYKCVKFKSLDVTARKNLVKKYSLCFLCLKSHLLKNCKSEIKCSICFSKFHNTLLHEESKSSNALVSRYVENKGTNKVVPKHVSKPNDSIKAQEVATEGHILSTAAVQNNSLSLLPTAKVKVFNLVGEPFEVNILLDSGSECSFILESLVQKLQLKRKNCRIPLKGIGALSAGLTRGTVNVKLSSIVNDETININTHILSKLTSPLPVNLIDAKHLNYIKGIPLADPEFYKPKDIHIILGADYFFSILQCGQITGPKNEPVAQYTMFGWVISGKINSEVENSNEINSHFVELENNVNIDSILRQFWELEELPRKNKFFTEEEEFCENHFKENYRINENGRFVVKLPVLNDNVQFGNTKQLAFSRLLAMERKFNRDPELEKAYKAFMKDYEESNHMKVIKEELNENPNSKLCYLPHHAIVRNDSVTTKLRVVFDGSCKGANVTSLNSVLGVCPVLQPDIFSILIRFRLSKIAFSADIK